MGKFFNSGRTVILNFIILIIIIISIFYSNIKDKIFAGTDNDPIPSMESLKVQSTFRQIAKKIIPSVVTIQSFADSIQLVRPDLPSFYQDFLGYRIAPNTPLSIGTGFIVDKRGYIITNYHVIKKSTRTLIRLMDGRIFDAEIIGFDSGIDIAVLKIEGTSLPEVEIGDSQNIEVGDWAIAIGNPSGYEGTFTVGVVSAKNRTEDTTGVYQKYIQTDAAINPGNSGGPLISINGKVIGVNSWIHSRTGQSSGISFAIPINTVIQYLSDIVRTGSIERNGYIGVVIRDARLINPNQYGGYVVGLEPGGPAEKGGIKQKDIIIAINGIHIDDIYKYMQLIINSRVGETVEFSVLRDGRQIELKVKIGKEPIEKAYLNIAVEDINPQHRRKLGLLEQDVGVIIKNIMSGSAMEKAGFKEGDLIFMMDNYYISNIFEFKKVGFELATRKVIFIKAKRRDKIVFGYIKIQD